MSDGDLHGDDSGVDRKAHGKVDRKAAVGAQSAAQRAEYAGAADDDDDFFDADADSAADDVDEAPKKKKSARKAKATKADATDEADQAADEGDEPVVADESHSIDESHIANEAASLEEKPVPEDGITAEDVVGLVAEVVADAIAEAAGDAADADAGETAGVVEAVEGADTNSDEGTESTESTQVDQPELADAELNPEVTTQPMMKPGLQVPLDGRQEELPLIETVSAAEAAQAAAEGERITVADLPMLVPDTTDLPPHELRAVVEALLYVATRPLTVKKLQECLPGTSPAYLEGFLAGLAERFDAEQRGWELRRLAGGWQLLTRRSLYPWVRQLDRKELPNKLSKSALETLAIVAYKQPITRGEVEDIRGVQCGPVLRQLMDLKLVSVGGRSETLLGRPLLYGTTDQFLTRFGLGSVDDLPKKHEFGA